MNVDAFLAPLDAINPSGADLRSDARFHALENQLEPANRKARLHLIENGGNGSVDLDWDRLAGDARDLAATGRDLRLLIIVVRLMVNQQGMAGLAEGLKLLADTVRQYWDSLHPALRENPSRREAALRRSNALYQIENSDAGILCDVEFVTLLNVRGVGPVTGGDLAAAALSRGAFLAEQPTGLGEKELSEMAARHELRVNRASAACRATAAERPDELAALAGATAASESALADLEAALDPHVTENGIAVRFPAMARMLSRIRQTLAAGSAAQQTGKEAPVMPSPAPAPGTPPTTAPVAPAGAPLQVNSRRDVEKCLDLIVDFYERTEPSSPIPHLARRLRKMVPMNFMQLMEEIAPSGIKEFRNVAGVVEEKNR